MAETRILGVLQRIALGYGFAALLVHFVKLRTALRIGGLMLLLYWALLIFFRRPHPDGQRSAFV